MENNITKRFIKFAVPSIVGMLIVSVQSIIDGMFVSKGVGPEGLAAINLSMPLTSVMVSIGVMIVSGGVVISAVAHGKGNEEFSRGYTSLTLAILTITSFVLSAIILLNLKSICYMLGANELLYPHVRDYISIIGGLVFFYVSPAFTEAFVRLREKPNWVFISGLTCCVLNILLDWLFVLELDGGTRGAAIATVLANFTAALILFPLIRFGKIRGGFIQIKKIFYNGSSEMFTSVAAGVTTYIFNLMLMRDIGHIGVAALTIVFYFNTLINMSIFGLSQALYPLMSYNLGAKNLNNIKKLLNAALKISLIIGVSVFVFILFFKEPIIAIFANGNTELASLATRAITYVSIAYLLSFINIIGSGFHTSIEKPIESVVIALCRSIIFVLIPLFTLPGIFEKIGISYDLGIWLSIPIGELLSLTVTIPLIRRSMRHLQNIYHA